MGDGAGTGALQRLRGLAGLAAMLALLVGAASVALRLLRWVLSNRTSLAVITRFTVAATALIIASKTPALVSVRPGNGSPLVAVGDALCGPNGWSLAATASGC